jgi:arylsulfatase A-like enzyme
MVDWIDLWDQVTEFRQTAPEWHHDTYGALASPIPEEAYHTNWITDRFIDDLKITSGDDPFFSWVSYIKPHHPFDPPGRYAEMYDPKDIPLPEPDDLSTKPHVASWRPDVGHFDISRWQPEDIQRMTALYYGNITLIDDCVGRIVRALEEKGIADNTVIIVTSDHGDFLGNRGFITKTPFVLYDDIVRVPFVVADGREQRQGQTSDAFVNLLDLFPTIMSLAGIGHDHRIHGHDLCPLLSGEVSQVTDMVVSESPWRQLAIRKGAWKLIQGPSNAACELYNLEIDPGERNNRFEEMAGSTVVADLRESALRYLLGTTWDRHICDVVGVQKVVDDEMKRLKREPLTIDPHSWRDSWPEELG